MTVLVHFLLGCLFGFFQFTLSESEGGVPFFLGVADDLVGGLLGLEQLVDVGSLTHGYQISILYSTGS